MGVKEDNGGNRWSHTTGRVNPRQTHSKENRWSHTQKGARELGEQETISRFNKSKNKTSGGHGRRIQVTVQTKSPNHTIQLQKGGTVTTETFKHQLVLEDVTIYTIV